MGMMKAENDPLKGKGYINIKKFYTTDNFVQ